MGKIPLVNLRKSKGLSQKKLAINIEISPSAIAQYELGSRKPSLENALRIAHYFDVPVESISFVKEKECKEERDVVKC